MAAPDGRVVVYMQNRRDHPDASQPPIDFPGITVLQYAGNGKFSLEEDFWSLPEGIETAKRSAAAYRDVDPGVPEAAHAPQLGQRPGVDAGRADVRREPGRDRAPDAAVPELPQMQALSERIEEWLRGATFEGYDAARLHAA